MKRLFMLALLFPLVGCAKDQPDPCKTQLESEYEECHIFDNHQKPNEDLCRETRRILMDCRIAQQKQKVKK